jgi:hypothetical protein
MVPQATISGRVLKSDGTPTSKLQVYVVHVVDWNGQKRVFVPGMLQAAPTDDHGEYRMYWMAPGQYYIVGWDMSTRTATYFPGVSDFAKAQAVQVKGGEESTGVNFTMIEAPYRSIRGKLVLPVSGLPDRAAVFPIPQDSSIPVGPSFSFLWRPNDTTQGEFKLGALPPPLPAGAIDLFAVETVNRADYFGHASIPAGGNAKGLQIKLQPGADIKGHVTILSGSRGTNPVTSMPIDLRSMTRIPFDTVCRGGIYETCRDKRSVPALSSSGNFVIHSIPDGHYSILPALPPGMYLADVRQRGKSILDSGLIVENGKPPESLEVIVNPNGAEVRGILQDSDQHPVSLTRVVLVPEPSRRQNLGLFRWVHADPDGEFHFDGIPPGNYELFAWFGVEEGAWTSPDFLEQHPQKGTAVTLKEGEQRNGVRVSLIP